MERERFSGWTTKAFCTPSLTHHFLLQGFTTRGWVRTEQLELFLGEHPRAASKVPEIARGSHCSVVLTGRYRTFVMFTAQIWDLTMPRTSPMWR